MNRRLISTRVQPRGGIVSTAEPGGTADTVTETVRGLAVVYGEVFTRWGVPLIYAPDSLTLPTDLGSIKLTAEHDPERPIGYATAAENGDDGLALTFELPDLPHTGQLRAELASRLRDGLSIITHLDEDTYAAVEARMWGEDDSTEPITIRGALREATIATVPQFSGARIQHSTQEDDMNRRLVSTTAEPDAIATIPAPPRAADAIAGIRTRPVSFATALAERIVGARTGSGESGAAAVIASALADITPGGNGAGNELAGLATQAMGELAEETYDPIYDVIVTKQTLTGMKVQGWSWSVLPTVGDYLGDKAEIPSNPAKLAWAEVNAQRLAGGHDLDRIYVDLGDPVTVLTSYWRNMSMDLQIKLDAKRVGAVQAAAGAAIPVPGASGVKGTITAAILAGLAAVPDANYVVISADLWAEEGGKPESELPALLSGAGIFADLLPSTIVNGVGLANEVIVGRKDAVNFHEFEPPVRLEALNIPQAGIDAGLYSYWAALTAAPGAVKRYTLTVGAAEDAAAGRSK
jgi:hypothetical protein